MDTVPLEQLREKGEKLRCGREVVVRTRAQRAQLGGHVGPLARESMERTDISRMPLGDPFSCINQRSGLSYNTGHLFWDNPLIFSSGL